MSTDEKSSNANKSNPTAENICVDQAEFVSWMEFLFNKCRIINAANWVSGRKNKYHEFISSQWRKTYNKIHLYKILQKLDIEECIPHDEDYIET